MAKKVIRKDHIEVEYALPAEKKYPITDINQAITAIQAVSGRAEEENVKNAVYRRFPALKGFSGNFDPAGPQRAEAPLVQTKKAQPGGANVHVPAPPQTEAQEEEERIHNVGMIPPDIANLEVEVIKDYEQEDEDGDNPGADPTYELNSLQELIEGIDWEMGDGRTDDYDEAKEIATTNLAEDADYYKRRMYQQDWSGDEVEKDTEQTEDESESNWPVGLNLDLCSGPCRKPGHIGFDIYKHDHGTLVHDLTMGIPVPDESASNVRLTNGLEYMEMDDPKPLLSEVQRVLMPGGQFHYEGPNEIYNYPDWLEETGRETNEDSVEKADSPIFKQTFTRLATPDAATADDAEPRIGINQYDMLPADALLAMDALGYSWSDATSSGRGNRIIGYPSQGALLSRNTEEEANNSAVHKEDVAHDPEELDALGAALESFAEKFMGFLGEEKEEKVRKSHSVPIAKLDKKKQIAYCVVLTPDEIDAQGDYMTADDIEEAAHKYLADYRVIGSNHEKPVDAIPVESYIAPCDIEWDGGPYGPQLVKQGSWVVGIKVLDAKEWAKIEDGETQGVSVGGRGARD